MGLKVVFMGTPAFASYMLEGLISSSHRIVSVVTVADKPAGRGQQLRESAVKETAKKAEIPILQPISLKDESFLAALQAFDADVFVVVAFRMLPEVVWKMPSRGTINLHASLLPNYRGAAPINWAIINGESQTGLTTFFINEAIDCGAILKQHTMEILPGTTAGELHDQMLDPGVNLILETLHAIENNLAESIPQSATDSTKEAPKLTKLNTRVNFNATGLEITNLVNGLNPYPSAYCLLRHKPSQRTVNFKIFSGVYVPEEHPLQVLSSNKDGILFPCLDGYFCVQTLQPEGKRSMNYKEFLAGNDISQFELID
jgi:methionyl-tRNA formyltransferase